MRNFKQVLLALVAIVFAAPSFAADMGVSQGRDLDALWASAQQDFDTDTEDAVLLLESREVTVNGDGTKSTRVHTVVWITSSVGIRGYADLRVPWDTATSELEVEVLRTWMDEQWWPDPVEISETAVVHTLPHALRTAHDYTTMRETMLLHDGVELPCIMETVYTITEQMAFDHTDGLMIMPQRDPAVRVELTVKAPTGVEVKHEALNGAPEPVVANAGGRLVMTWAMDNVAPLKMPITAAPERYEPAVVWSTWPDWATLIGAWESRLDADAVLGPALADTLARFRADHAARGMTVHALVDWLDESVRAVHYDPSYWFGRTRDAATVWTTGYGHALDRAVLLQAMLDEPHAKIRFRGTVDSDLAAEIPRLSGLGDVVVRDETSDSYIDVEHGTVIGSAQVPTMPAGGEGKRILQCGTAGREGEYSLSLTLEPTGEGAWKGTGTLRTTGPLTHWTTLTANAEGSQNLLGGVLGSVLEGAELTAATPLAVQAGREEFLFSFTLPAPEENQFGEKRLVVGTPASALLSVLPPDVHPEAATRESPVILGPGLTQSLVVSIKGGAGALPADEARGSGVGRFSLAVEEAHGWTTIRRDLELKGGRVEAEDWPALRALLLEEQDPRHGTIIFE